MSRTRSPYAPPKSTPVASGRASRFRPILWWGLLVAPCLAILLAMGAAGALYKLGYPVAKEVRDTLITTSVSWVTGLLQAALLFPSAWLLERIVHRLRRHREHSPALALPITVIWFYVLGTTDMLEEFGYVPREHLLAQAVLNASVAILVAFIPLLLVWAVVAFRQRRG